MRHAALSLTSLLLCACASSPPVRYFTLDPVAPATSEKVPMADPVQLAGVHLPASLDRREIVRENAPNTLTIDAQDRWGASLSDLTERALSQDLLLRLTPGGLVLTDQPAPQRTRAVSVELLEFGVVASGAVALEGSWAVVPSGSDAATQTHHFLLTARAPTRDSAAEARLMSVLLGRLADSISHSLATQPEQAGR
jgi:uncharacterized protein